MTCDICNQPIKSDLQWPCACWDGWRETAKCPSCGLEEDVATLKEFNNVCEDCKEE